ncbi:MAG: asparagine synthase C-terminal domain-containing protein [Nitrososphaeria archaeon]
MQKGIAEEYLIISALFGGPTTLDSLNTKVTLKEMQEAVRKERGQFAIKASNEEMSVFATDPSGAFGIPLLGIKTTPRLKNGFMVIKKNGIVFYKTEGYSALSGYNIDVLLTELVLFINNIKGKVAVAFSGGLDSSLLAWLLREKDPILITVGDAKSHDIVMAKRSANIIGLGLETIEPKNTTEIIRFVSSFSRTLMDYSLAVGFYTVAKRAKELGAKWLVTGQMADELFGGYSKYKNINEKNLNAVLFKDFLNSNLQRDTYAILSGGVVPVFPYASRPFANLALGLPAYYKINKRGLRIIASMAGLPDELVKSEKKAFQYGSGIERIVYKIINNSPISI